MKAILLILGLTFSMTIFAEEPANSGYGQNEGCGGSMENCECIVSGTGTEPGTAVQDSSESGDSSTEGR